MVKVMQVAAMPITKATMPKGKMQRYHDFSVPPVARASLFKVAVESVVAATGSPDFPPWRQVSELDLQFIILAGARWKILTPTPWEDKDAELLQ